MFRGRTSFAPASRCWPRARQWARSRPSAAATDPAAGGGQYFGPDRLFETRGHPIVVRSSTRSQDRVLQSRLWALYEELTGVTWPT